MSPAPATEKSSRVAVFFAAAALFIILYQLRVASGALADTPVFAAALIAAWFGAIVLAERGVKPLPAVAVIALIPWAARLLIALPRLFFGGAGGGAVLLDSLLLNYDRNTFVSLVPFYALGLTVYFSSRSRLALRGLVIAADVLLIGLFSLFPIAAAYRYPVWVIMLFAVILFFQFIAVVVSLPVSLALQRRERGAALAMMLLLTVGGSLLFLGPLQHGAVQAGGGLLEPKLFQFDISQILSLENEISLKKSELVLIVKKDFDDDHTLLRRFVLSGYNHKKK